MSEIIPVCVFFDPTIPAYFYNSFSCLFVLHFFSREPNPKIKDSSVQQVCVLI